MIPPATMVTKITNYVHDISFIGIQGGKDENRQQIKILGKPKHLFGN